ncbi:uncharacterized protein BO97DRAFT_415415 [Aspergillus homomorphus CBS 101889]|uniref:Uncharacterized protein n=1 Tax=Aspergillus homomorphus (strain CBS 101889) TaxID=1450537 RepID=A0A395HUM9_ASPHC|nr:hypothetical protein BO97DRAFT_415415 [Aspergillus homomorphus CBS 101889]RAL11236.1 hypothetical protein BO97DRAFT_415415 [Aspergillus homomorphus CBS 101889]
MRFLSCFYVLFAALLTWITHAAPTNGGVNCTQLEQQIATLQQGISKANSTNPERVQAAQQLLDGARILQASECNTALAKRINYAPPTGPINVPSLDLVTWVDSTSCKWPPYSESDPSVTNPRDRCEEDQSVNETNP